MYQFLYSLLMLPLLLHTRNINLSF